MKPILFSTPMVQAVLAGNKSQTRRVIKIWDANYDRWEARNNIRNDPETFDRENCVPCYLTGKAGVFDIYTENDKRLCYYPKYDVGDILWVRETWNLYFDGYAYKADIPTYPRKENWKPSIHMPKKAARLFLKVTDVRVERLQDIPPEDCHAEGIMNDVCATCLEVGDICRPQRDVDAFCGGEETIIDKYATLWENLNSKRNGGLYAWEKNPWVWVYTFERTEKPLE